MGLTGDTIRGMLELESKGLRINYVTNNSGIKECQISIRSSNEFIHSGEGFTHDEAFCNANETFDQSTAYGRTPKQMADEEARLHERIAGLESELEDGDDPSASDTAERDSGTAEGNDAKPAVKKKKKKSKVREGDLRPTRLLAIDQEQD